MVSFGVSASHADGESQQQDDGDSFFGNHFPGPCKCGIDGQQIFARDLASLVPANLANKNRVIGVLWIFPLALDARCSRFWSTSGVWSLASVVRSFAADYLLFVLLV
jgi:hypothetical protein